MSEERQKSNPSTSRAWVKISVLALLAVGTGILYWAFREHLSLDALAQQETALRDYQQAHPVLVYVLAFVVYVLVTGLSLPGAAALTLVYGWYFGFLPSVVLVSFASTAGATIAFLISRYLLREMIQGRFGSQLKTFNEALDREGAFYLFTLRLIPAVPFFVINVVMGLTRVRTLTFWWVSQIGMFAGTLVYVYAGSTIPSLAHLADPSQVRSSEVTDWPALVGQLKVSAEADSTAAHALYMAMPQEAQRAIVTTSAEPDEEARQTILIGLNHAISQSDLALQPAWKNAISKQDLPEETAKEEVAALQRNARRRVTKVNRTILVAAFPNTISPPQPILSVRLIIAFAVLGLFPLAVKKAVGYFRDAPAESLDEEENS